MRFLNRFLIITVALIFGYAFSALAEGTPASKTSIPPQPEKEINHTNEVVESHNSRTTHKAEPSGLESFYGGPLSKPADLPVPDHKPGENALERLNRVQNKLESKPMPDKSKAVEKIEAVKAKIEEKMEESKIDQTTGEKVLEKLSKIEERLESKPLPDKAKAVEKIEEVKERIEDKMEHLHSNEHPHVDKPEVSHGRFHVPPKGEEGLDKRNESRRLESEHHRRNVTRRPNIMKNDLEDEDRKSDEVTKGDERNKNQNAIRMLEHTKAKLAAKAHPNPNAIEKIERNRARLVEKRS